MPVSLEWREKVKKKSEEKQPPRSHRAGTAQCLCKKIAKRLLQANHIYRHSNNLPGRRKILGTGSNLLNSRFEMVMMACGCSIAIK